MAFYELLSSWEQRGKFPRGYDPRGFMTAEGKQAALIASYKIIGIANFREGQQKIIAWIRRAFDVRQGDRSSRRSFSAR